MVCFTPKESSFTIICIYQEMMEWTSRIFIDVMDDGVGIGFGRSGGNRAIFCQALALSHKPTNPTHLDPHGPDDP
jgi:hypothetical protein